MPTRGSLTFGLLQTVLERNMKTAIGLGSIFQYQYQLIMVPARSSGEIHIHGME